VLDLDRRTFLASVVAAAALRAGPAAAATPDEVLLNRLTFGASPAARADLSRMGPRAWIEAQLAPGPDPDLDRRLAAARLRIESSETTDGEGRAIPVLDELRPLATLGSDPAGRVRLTDWTIALPWAERVRPAEEVIHASLIRAVHAKAQLNEVMTQFWHDHFNVHATKSEMVAAWFPDYDAGLRAHALGNFRTLLQHVATAPAMLVYLTNDESRASPANENFARELLELHTLGAGNYLSPRPWTAVPGVAQGLALGYMDDDVYEVARAFTGWTVGDGRWTGDGEQAPRDGRFHYVEAWHDPYQKRILGREFADHQAPLADGEQVLDLLATHPGTAAFVCAKIARRLLSDDPAPGLVDRLAQVFLAAADAPDQIAQVILALTGDPAFAAPPSKLRRPFEVMAALYRATGAEVEATEGGWSWTLSRAGWLQHTFPPPTGHPDRAEAWQSGTMLLRLAEIALYGHDEWFGVTSLRLDAPGARTLGDAARHWGERLTGRSLDLSAALAAVGAEAGWDWPQDGGERHEFSAMLVAAAALSPEFLYR
jgi:uncharacterized protein (DUF1800 family)